jgi:hypothetical protein
MARSSAAVRGRESKLAGSRKGPAERGPSHIRPATFFSPSFLLRDAQEAAPSDMASCESWACMPDMQLDDTCSSFPYSSLLFSYSPRQDTAPVLRMFRTKPELAPHICSVTVHSPCLTLLCIRPCAQSTRSPPSAKRTARQASGGEAGRDEGRSSRDSSVDGDDTPARRYSKRTRQPAPEALQV